MQQCQTYEEHNEELVKYFSWVDMNLEYHEEFIGVHPQVQQMRKNT